MPIYMTFIGSRKLAEPQFADDARFFYKFAYRCAQLGIILRSGGADGADVIAEKAYADAIKNGEATASQVEIFVPWKPFQAIKGINNPLYQLHINVTDKNIIQRAEAMVREIHPIYKRVGASLSFGAMKLHSRNMFQVFGQDLNTPISANVCWTEHGIKSGGTASAITLSENNSIPVFNLGSPNREQVLLDFKNLLLNLGLIT